MVVKNGSKKSRQVSGGNAVAGVAYRDVDGAIAQARLPHRPPGPGGQIVHRFHGVQDETEQHLLDADSIGSDLRQARLELRGQRDAASPRVRLHEA